MIARRFRPIVLCVGCVLLASEAAALDYAEARSKAVLACEAISSSESQSGLLFNPDGFRSYYVRSKCFQDAAVLYRDVTLCDQVRERRSLLFSSWGYAPARCRQLVTQGEARDRAELEKLKRAYAAGGIRLRDFRIERNGNGRDIDIIPILTGTYAHGYTLTFEILPGSGAPQLLYTTGSYLDEKSDLRYYIPQATIRQRFPAFALNRSYTVRATVTLDVGFGGQSGYWSPALIERVFSARERTHSMSKVAAF
jgi:hypothetical protein